VENVEIEDVEEDFLKELYRLNFTQGLTYCSYRKWCADAGVLDSECNRGYNRLIDSGLAKAAAMGMTMAITAEGTLYLETGNLVDPQLAEEQDQCRKTILRRGAEEYARNGRRGLVYFRHVAPEVNVSERVFNMNLFLLRDIGAIELRGQNFVLTEHGRKLVKALDFSERIEARWVELKHGEAMTPQTRGHALEELLAEIARWDGLDVETRVRSTGEENDLVISEGHDHFLVSCKWEKKRASSDYLDSLRMRLLKRPGTLGMLVSVGGFTRDLVKEAEGNTSLGLVMLLGRGDLERLFTGQVRLGEMMVDRHTTLARYRRAVFED